MRAHADLPLIIFFLDGTMYHCRGGGSKNSLVGLNAKLLSNFNFNN